MTLTELRYVVAVARERHFGHAAEACFVSQPTLSVAVKKLEEELELTLFIFRRRRGDEPEFRVPLHPVVPTLFVLMCAYMLYSSIDYVRNPDYGPKFGFAVLGGLVVMAAGIPLYFLSRRR